MKSVWYAGFGRKKAYFAADTETEAKQQSVDYFKIPYLPVEAVQVIVDNHVVYAVSNEEIEQITDTEEVETVEAITEYDIDSMSRTELIQKAKELGIDGKIATFKTEDLREKVKEKLEGDKVEAIREDNEADTGESGTSTESN
jgi:hypothetical protein